MTHTLSEDDLYRTSTQYRLWSFSPEQLAARRRKTHDLALQRARQYEDSSHNGTANGNTHGDEQYLTEAEEVRLVQRYCNILRATSDHLQFPPHVKATAIQYLKRFYLSNSCMTYPPKEIYKTVLFLAQKIENAHWTVAKFAQRISADAEAILAPEYKIMQALRFTLDVRQPFRGLKGVLMEMLNMAQGQVRTVEGVPANTSSPWQDRMRELAKPQDGARTKWRAPTDGGQIRPEQLADRIQLAYTAAREVVDEPASLTDAYLLYTPSQILLAAMQLADEPLLDFYMDSKLPPSSPIRPKILATIRDCAISLAAFDLKKIMSKDESRELEKKLEQCRDPSTKDLIKNHEAMKRNGAEEGKVNEQDAKRRKLEREKNGKETDDMFGPALSNAKTNG